jgi:hypothetical protein
MPMYVIERSVSGAGRKSAADLKAIAQKSCDVLRVQGSDIQWQHSSLARPSPARTARLKYWDLRTGLVVRTGHDRWTLSAPCARSRFAIGGRTRCIYHPADQYDSNRAHREHPATRAPT